MRSISSPSTTHGPRTHEDAHRIHSFQDAQGITKYHKKKNAPAPGRARGVLELAASGRAAHGGFEAALYRRNTYKGRGIEAARASAPRPSPRDNLGLKSTR
jgi:hypothetical protein